MTRAGLIAAACLAITVVPSVAEPLASPIITDTTDLKASNALGAIAEDYVKVTLALGEKEAGYVDAYYGPAKWAEAAKTDPRDMRELGNALVELMQRLDALPKSDDPLIEARKRFLSAQLEAAVTRHAMIQGEIFAFAKEAEGLFGVTPELRPLEEFDPVLEEIENLAPGDGPLSERVAALEKGYIIPKDRLQIVFDTAIAECKARTAKYFDLPEGENFKLEFVTGKSWSGYNYYQGNYQSLIQVNTDLPIFIGRAVDLGCHEGYPGHHVYNMLLERNLTKGRGWQEFSVYPLYSPQSLIAEGSANYGIELAFSGQDRLDYERDILYPLAGLDPDTAAAYWALQIAKQALSGARMTITQRYLDGEITREQAIVLTQKYQLVSRERAEQMTDFAEQYRSYVINYGLGMEMVRDWIEAQGDAPVWRWKAMERLLSEPMLPGDLVGVSAEADHSEAASKIWREFVPDSGQADTVQGELLRSVEKLRDEAIRNGNGNWDEGFEILITYLEEKLLDEPLFEESDRSEIAKILGRLQKFDNPLMNDEPYDFLVARVVDYYDFHGSQPRISNPELKR
ncbi:hypothetical protein [Parasphingorhabdus sp.]|uniref:hypothetical protein n=1 Tax=Parasphingorhabdus sp. TaxID=2709688 RepID=UPI002B272194|nr:hypothetical protein [Parasphingorhabdus sp.]